MTLDLLRALPQIQAGLGHLQATETGRRERLAKAAGLLALRGDELRVLRTRLREGRYTWLPADPVEPMDSRQRSAAAPADYSAIGVDGSQIEVDRHAPLPCYLINLGSAAIRYGLAPSARLESRPSLFAGEEALTITNPANPLQTTRLDSVLLAVRRSVAEIVHLAELAEARGEGKGSDPPTLLLLDGSLILWPLGARGYDDYVRHLFLGEGFLAALNRLRAVVESGRALVAGYISRSDSTNVDHALRLAACPYEPINCDHYCRQQRASERPCDSVGDLLDRDLLAGLLEPGERSALFRSQSRVVQEWYGEHGISFFYLHVGDEIARVEVPAWLAQDARRMDLLHGLILDQCRRGGGYPVALSEAHEMAVVHEADRQQFWALVDSLLAPEQSLTSAKAASKRRPAL
ncbi:MAG: DNA double-strand break repair nuclease NurA [Chloroflexi bacterium]|nr:DNA double-strand break repair nuclease NurA [Chloroflexota bacterium]